MPLFSRPIRKSLLPVKDNPILTEAPLAAKILFGLSFIGVIFNVEVAVWLQDKYLRTPIVSWGGPDDHRPLIFMKGAARLATPADAKLGQLNDVIGMGLFYVVGLAAAIAVVSSMLRERKKGSK
jgi:hypothetical protein